MNKNNAGKKRGFTLIELLVVLAIIAILIAAVTPGLFDVIKSTRLTSAGDTLLTRLSLAQQSAMTYNTPVEFRFYKFEDPDEPSATQFFRAYQVIKVKDSGSTIVAGDEFEEALSEPTRLESGVAISENDGLSPLFKYTYPEQKKFFKGYEAQYAALRFYPDGSFKISKSAPASPGQAAEANLVTPVLAESFFTLADMRDLEGYADGGVPKNYYCIQLDAYTGKARTYRP